MKRIITIASALLLITNFAFAQKKEKEKKYDKVFYKEAKVETPDYDITITQGVSTEEYTKFRLKITNKTASYLIYKPAESKFMINNTPSNVNEKEMVIDPYQSEGKTIDLKGKDFNKVFSYSFVAGGVYKVTPPSTSIPAEDFKLPPAKNAISAGPFVITQEKLSKETDKTSVKFSCVYNGDKMGLVFPQKTNMRMPDDKDYATVKKEKPILMTRGKSENFTLEWNRMQGGKVTDMQKVDMIIKWNDAFSEATPEPLKAETLTLEMDEAKSK
jgi:hypothetical protein